MAFSLLTAMDDCVDGRVDGIPFLKQLAKHLRAIVREAIEPLVALFFFAPLAHQQPLRFEPAKKWVECAFVDSQTAFGEVLPQGVPVMLVSELNKHSEGQAAATELQTEVFKEVLCKRHAVPRTLY